MRCKSNTILFKLNIWVLIANFRRALVHIPHLQPQDNTENSNANINDSHNPGAGASESCHSLTAGWEDLDLDHEHQLEDENAMDWEL